MMVDQQQKHTGRSRGCQKKMRKKRGRRIRQEAAIAASTLLAAFFVCSSSSQQQPLILVEAFRTSVSPSAKQQQQQGSSGSSVLQWRSSLESQQQQQTTKTTTATTTTRGTTSNSRLFATIENDSMMSSDEEEKEDDDERSVSAYYRLQQQSSSLGEQQVLDAWSLEMRAAQEALEQLNNKNVEENRRTIEPLYAEKRTSTLAAPKNGNFNQNDAGPSSSSRTASTAIPLPVVLVEDDHADSFSGFDSLPDFGDGSAGFLEDVPAELASGENRFESLSVDDDDYDSDALTTSTTTTTSSRTMRVFSAMRNVVGNMSPVRIFGRGHASDDAHDHDDKVNTKELQRTQAETALWYDPVEESTTMKKKPTKEEKKQTKEEALVARMSRKKKKQLSNLLKSVNLRNTKSMAGMTARTLTGLLTALAEEAEDVSVLMKAREDTPIWRKQIDNLSIEFTRLGFKPLSMGGPDQQLSPKVDGNEKEKTKRAERPQPVPRVRRPQQNMRPILSVEDDDDLEDSCPVEATMADVSCADTAFERIDVDNSGALDQDEIADALVLAATSSSTSAKLSSSDSLPAPAAHEGDLKVINQLAKQLVDLYDTNDDGVIDRGEYQSMVEDMAALRQVQKEREQKMEEKQQQEASGDSWWSSAMNSVPWGNFNSSPGDEDVDAAIIQQLGGKKIVDISNASVTDDLLAMTESALEDDGTPNTVGKIELEDVKIDLRQLVFGAMPGVKHITPGGPLFLEPFKVTITGSWTAEDVMKSTLLDAGLRQLVSFALRVRVRSIRDVMDGAVFYGRKWKRGSAKAPLVECTELTSIEIDDQDRAIITGRAKIRATTDAPVIDQSFKLRTKVATPRNGRAIKLSEPEIAIVLECPQQWEQSLNSTFAKFNMKPPPRPEPIYRYIPIHSPFNKNDDIGGYYMGEDNQIKSMYIKDKCLRFEMETILRPGKFLGSHYLAFTVPQRALIITVDRVKNGMKAARRRKKKLKALVMARAAETDRKAHHAEDALALDDIDEGVSNSGGADGTKEEPNEHEDDKPSVKAFISRFVDGYLQAGSGGENKERLAHAISDWFGRQSSSNEFSNGKSAAGIETQRPGDAVTNLVEDIALDLIMDDDVTIRL